MSVDAAIEDVGNYLSEVFGSGGGAAAADAGTAAAAGTALGAGADAFFTGGGTAAPGIESAFGVTAPNFGTIADIAPDTMISGAGASGIASAAPSGVDSPDFLRAFGDEGANVAGRGTDATLPSAFMETPTPTADNGGYMTGGGAANTGFSPKVYSVGFENALNEPTITNEAGRGGTYAPGNYMAGNPAAAPSAAAPADSAAPPTSIDRAFEDPSLGNIGRALGANANILLPGAALGYSAIRANRPIEGEQQLRDLASKLGMQGEQLQSYLAQGTVPPAIQARLNQAKESAKASIRSRYAARGMSGSSAEAQDLANVEAQTQAQGANMAIQLLQQGVSMAGLTGQIYQTLLSDALAKDKELGAAIGRFAAGAAGAGGGINIKVA